MMLKISLVMSLRIQHEPDQSQELINPKWLMVTTWQNA